MDHGIAGKRILITGSAGGCGAAIARALDELGAELILHDIPQKEELLRQESQGYRKAAYVTADLSNEASVEAMWEKVSGIDILINNAGIWPTAYVREMTADSFRKTLEINLIAPFLLSRNFVRERLASGKKGKIVNMVSQAAFHGSTTGHAHYAASKAALVGFTVSLAREVAANGILVNAVAPGMMRTPMNEQALSAREEGYLQRIPLGRIAEPSEVADAVVFLCSRQSDYMTGTTLDVTGGMLMR